MGMVGLQCDGEDAARLRMANDRGLFWVRPEGKGWTGLNDEMLSCMTRTWEISTQLVILAKASRSTL